MSEDELNHLFHEKWFEKHKLSLADYILQKSAKAQPVEEDVVPITRNDTPREKKKHPAEIVQLSSIKNVFSPKESKKIDHTVDWSVKHLANEVKQGKIREHSDIDFVVKQIEDTLVDSIPNIDSDEILAKLWIRFHLKTGMNMESFIWDLLKHHGKAKRNVSESILTEGINCASAVKCRKSLAKLIQNFVDSSDVDLMDNFKSYEDKDKIILKILVYAQKAVKLEQLQNRISGYLKSDGWYSPDKDSLKFSKDNVMVVMHPIKKVFRSGAYKNREVPTLRLEVFGPKKQEIKK